MGHVVTSYELSLNLGPNPKPSSPKTEIPLGLLRRLGRMLLRKNGRKIIGAGLPAPSCAGTASVLEQLILIVQSGRNVANYSDLTPSSKNTKPSAMKSSPYSSSPPMQYCHDCPLCRPRPLASKPHGCSRVLILNHTSNQTPKASIPANPTNT